MWNGARFWIDPVSVFGLSMLKNREFEKPLTIAVTTLLRPGDSFVDVGANEGYFSILAAQKVGVDGRVLAIEPQQRLRSVLERNIRTNSLTNVEIASLALADKEGKALLYLRPSTNTGASSLTRHWKLGHSAKEVRTTTLDQLLEKGNFGTVRMAKVDCEGAESLVISGAGDALAKHRIEILVIDYHPQIVGAEKCRCAHSQIIAAGYEAAVCNGLLFYFIASAKDDLNELGLLGAAPAWLQHFD